MVTPASEASITVNGNAPQEAVTVNVRGDLTDAGETEECSLSKLRHQRRLHDRWMCKTNGHTCCYVDTNLGVHLQLSDEDIDTWVATIQNGYATVLRAPESILSSNPDQSLANIKTSSSNSILHQRPFHFQLKPDLSDLRSWRNSLSSKSEHSVSSPSIVSSIGYYTGYVPRWLGAKLLSFIVAIDSRRRIWKAGRLIQRTEKVPGATLEVWLVKNQKSVNELIDDLLELSSDNYTAGIRKASITHGSRLQALLIQVEYHHQAAHDPIYWLLSCKASPFAFFDNEKDGTQDNGLGVGLRELLLQEQTDTENLDRLIAELAGCACDELLYGITPASRTLAWKLLFDIHKLSFGAAELNRFARPSGCLRKLAERMLEGKITDDEERFRAVQFFCLFAENFPAFKHYVTDSAENLIAIFKSGCQVESPDWRPLTYKCGTLGFVSHYTWGNATLLDHNICDLLVHALLVHQKAGYPEPWSDYNVMWVFHNVFGRGGERGRQAVCKAITPEVRVLFQYLVKTDVPWPTEDIGNHVRKWGAEMLDAAKEEETKTEVVKTEVAEKND